MQAVLIFLLSIAAAVTYGIVHDQVTARVCVEYFTIGHPSILGGTQDPTLLAFGWGIIATWWVGAILGVPLAGAARLGGLPKRTAVSLIRPMAVLLAVMGFCALIAGIVGYQLGQAGAVDIYIPMPEETIPRFAADAFAHLASYASGFLGGVSLIGWVLFTRWRASKQQANDS